MDYTRVICSVVIYLMIGLMVWLEIITDNNMSIKSKGYPKYKKEPTVFIITFLWLPLYIIGTIKAIIKMVKNLWKRIIN